MAAAAPLTAREYVQSLVLAGHPHARELAYDLDLADEVYGVIDEFAQLAPDVSLQDEARRLVTFEQRVLQMLEEWGALDPLADDQPDAIVVLRMLLG